MSRNSPSCVRPSVVCTDIGWRFDRCFTAPQKWGDRLPASTLKICSNFAQHGLGGDGRLLPDISRTSLPLAMTPDFTHCGGV